MNLVMRGVIYLVGIFIFLRIGMLGYGSGRSRKMGDAWVGLVSLHYTYLSI